MRRYLDKIDHDTLHSDMNDINWNEEVSIYINSKCLSVCVCVCVSVSHKLL